MPVGTRTASSVRCAPPPSQSLDSSRMLAGIAISNPLDASGRAIYCATDGSDSVRCRAVFQLLRRGPWGN